MRPPPGHAHYPSASGEGRARAARGTPGRAGRVRSCEGRRGGLLKRLCEGSERLCGGSERAPSGLRAALRRGRGRSGDGGGASCQPQVRHSKGVRPDAALLVGRAYGGGVGRGRVRVERGGAR